MWAPWGQGIGSYWCDAWGIIALITYKIKKYMKDELYGILEMAQNMGEENALWIDIKNNYYKVQWS